MVNRADSFKNKEIMACLNVYEKNSERRGKLRIQKRENSGGYP
jgi:hypothetical protein